MVVTTSPRGKGGEKKTREKKIKKWRRITETSMYEKTNGGDKVNLHGI